jgi:hypothetical protein
LIQPGLGLFALEPRIMFDGAAVAQAAHAAPDTAAKALIPDVPAAVEVRAADAAKDNGKKEVVFVDTSVSNYKTLEAGVAAGVGIVEIDGGKDGLAQMAKWAETHGGYDAIHILSHGAAGTLYLGSDVLTDAALATPTAQAELADIGHALNAGGDLLLYGCDVAAGSDGAQFVADLASATGADVAASTNDTGAAVLGGDWNLEKATGRIDAAALALTDYGSTLADVTTGNDPGAGYPDTNTLSSDDVAESFTATKTGVLKSVTIYGSVDNTLVSNISLTIYDGDGVSGSVLYTQTIADLNNAYLADVGNNRFVGTTITLGSTVDITTGHLYTIRVTSTPKPGNSNTLAWTYTNSSGGPQTYTGGTLYDFTYGMTDTTTYDLMFNVVQGDPPGPTVTDANISITSTGSGTGGAYKIGDTVTATWNDTAGGDNQGGITGVTMDFSAFGGGAAVAATNAAGNWTASYTIASGSVDGANKNVSVTAANATGSTTTADTSNLTVDNQPPTVSDARIAISGATGSGGTFKISDIVTATWNNTGAGDNNADIVGATVDFSAFGGGSAVAASNAAGTWTATYTIAAGAIDGTNKNVSVTATDNAGNTTTTADTTNATLDNQAPTVSDARIAISGATGSGGAYKIGDTITATWNNTGAGDNNADTISGVTVDFSQFGGGAAVAATNSGGTWTATYTIAAGAIDGTNKNVSVTATDNAGNTTTTADTTNATLDNQAPTVSDARIAISGATGTGGAYKIGDTITATWNNTGAGDNNADIVGATVDFSAFGGGSAVAATNSGGTWTATYTIVAGAIDGTNKNVSVTATDNAGNTTTTADTTNATLDNQVPTVSDARIAISGATGSGGAFKIGDAVTATWNNTAAGDNNADTISSVTVDFSQFGGGSAVAATNSGGTWTATYTIVAGAIDGTNKNVSVTATDNAGNTTTTADTTNATLDNQVPTVSDARIAISGATGSGGVYKIGDTVTATWNNTAAGDNNADTISGVTVDFSQFGGGAAVAASNAAGTWTATYTIAAGAIDHATNRNVSVTATDNAGNTKTTADTTNATVDNVAPTAASTPTEKSGNTVLSNGMNAAEKAGNLVATAALGTSGAVAGDTIELLLGGASFGTPLTHVLSAGDIATGSYDFTVAGSALGADGSKSLTSKITDAAGNVGAASAALTFTLDSTVPTVSNAVASQAVNDNATRTPFATLVIADANTVTVSVTLDTAAKGSFTTLNGFTDAGGGVYTYTGTAANATTAIQGLVFTPTANRVASGTTETTTFTVLATDAAGNATSNATTTVVSTSINDAPALDNAQSPALNGMGINPAAPANGTTTGSTLVSALVAGISDADSSAVKGVAVTGIDTADGTLYYSTDAGATWTAAGAVAANSALLLAADANTRLYYQSNNGVSGNLASALTIRAWDRTSGTAGSKVDTTTNGGTTAFSTATDTVSIAIYPPPTLGSFTAAQAVNDNATISPFAASTIANAGTGNNVTVTVTLDAQAKGSFTTLSGFTDNGNGSYTLANVASATAQSDLRGMVFTPAANRVAAGSTETTTFTVDVTDVVTSVVASNAATTVVSTSINDAPTIGGAAAGQAVNDNATLSPFAGLTIADPDASAAETVTITLDAAAKGAFTAASLSASGFSTADGGLTYTHAAGSPAALQAAIRQLVYQPAANRVAPNGTETTNFTVSVSDGIAAAATNNTTTVVSTSVNDAPTLTGIAGDSLSYLMGGSATVIDQGSAAGVSDIDSAVLTGGTLTVSIAANRVAAEDVLAIRNQGTGTGQIGVSGADVSYDGTVIGTYTGGTGTNDLVITFNANATTDAASALLRNITYANANANTVTESTRTVRFVVTDGAGGTSAAADASVVVSSNTPPTAADGMVDMMQNGSHTFSTGDFPFSDVDPGDSLQEVKIVSLPTHGALTLDDVAVSAGQIISAADIAKLKYTPEANGSGDAYATFQFQVGDGKSFSATHTKTIKVTALPTPLPPTPPAPAPIVVAPPPVAPPLEPLPPPSALTHTFEVPTAPSSHLGSTSSLPNQGGSSGDGGTLMLTRADGFQVPVLRTGSAGTETALLVVRPMADQSIGASTPVISIQVPHDVFASTSADASIMLGATLADGRPLPGWLHFDPARGSFEGVVPPGVRGDFTIRLTAVDNQGHRVVTTFHIRIGASGDGSLDRGGPHTAIGKPSLAAQFERHGAPGRHAGANDLLLAAHRAAQRAATTHT